MEVVDRYQLISVIVLRPSASERESPGAPNENIVQNHLNIAMLNVLQYLNGRYWHIFIP